MRILVMHSRYATGASSGENRVVDDEVALLRQRGHEVELWSPTPAGGVRAAARLGVDATWSREAVRVLGRMRATLRPDVIHVHNLFPLLSPAVLRSAGAPVVLTLHNYRLLCLPATFLREGRTCERCLGGSLLPGVVHGCYRGSVAASGALAGSLTLHRKLGTFDRVAAFFAVSPFVRSKHIEAGFDPERIWVKPNFVPETARRDGPGGDFLYLGRLSVEKGLDRLMQVWQQVPARLVVVGDGPEREALVAAAPPNVEFRGAVDPGEVPGLLRAARALVLPSICYEGAPRTVVEAYAAGVPVIGSRLGAIADVVDEGRTGMLARPGDAGEWSAAVHRLLIDEESVRMGGSAYDTWRHSFSPEVNADLLEHLYNRVMAGSSPARSHVILEGMH
jgi:glycosyltransferase involved in cell wall biosynthesis